MTLAIDDTAPDFEAETTEGKIHFHDWVRNLLGRAIFASQGFHAGLHDRARLPWRDSSPNSTSVT